MSQGVNSSAFQPEDASIKHPGPYLHQFHPEQIPRHGRLKDLDIVGAMLARQKVQQHRRVHGDVVLVLEEVEDLGGQRRPGLAHADGGGVRTDSGQSAKAPTRTEHAHRAARMTTPRPPTSRASSLLK